jgi:hypothetical protein
MTTPVLSKPTNEFCEKGEHKSCEGYLQFFPHLKGYRCNCLCHKKAKILSKPVKILDDVFNIPGVSYGRRWESLSIEEKIGALAEKLDEVIGYLESNS